MALNSIFIPATKLISIRHLGTTTSIYHRKDLLDDYQDARELSDNGRRVCRLLFPIPNRQMFGKCRHQKRRERKEAEAAKLLIILVELTGIEPVTS